MAVDGNTFLSLPVSEVIAQHRGKGDFHDNEGLTGEIPSTEFMEYSFISLIANSQS
jgi:hypothetical protein